MAGLGLFPEPYLVPYGTSAPAGRKYPAGGICHPVAFPAQPSGPDIKPYVPYADARPEARSGFAQGADRTLEVQIPAGEREKLPEEKREALIGILRQDPRPHYQKDPKRVYGLTFDHWNVKFRVEDDTVYVVAIELL